MHSGWGEIADDALLTVSISSVVVDEIKRIIKSSEILKYGAFPRASSID